MIQRSLHKRPHSQFAHARDVHHVTERTAPRKSTVESTLVVFLQPHRCCKFSALVNALKTHGRSRQTPDPERFPRWSRFIIPLSFSPDRVESVEGVVPELCVPGDPFLCNLQPGSVRPNDMFASLPLALDEPGLFQHPQVLGNGRERHPKWLRQRRDAALLRVRQTFQNAPACGVGQAENTAVRVLLLTTRLNDRFDDRASR